MRITRSWYAPVSGIFIAACGLYALIGFPLDDIWHRMFGQDVTLWLLDADAAGSLPDRDG